jgi:crossover junction endodeoxyribonuclease RuvC
MAHRQTRKRDILLTPPTHILGVDPGLSGAFCLLQVSSRRIEALWDMPVADGRVDPEGVALIVDSAKSATGGQLRAAVENVSSMPRQAGAFNFGRSAGVIHGVLGAMGVPMDLISPNVWKGAMGLRRLVNETQDQNKTRARELAMKLWPESAGLFRRVKDDGRAEAALIARFAISKT